MIKVAVNDRRSGVTYHRLIAPMSLLKDQLDVFSFTSPHQLEGKEFNVVIFNRSFGLERNIYDLMFLQDLRNAGVKIIMDIDDYWELPPHHTIQWRKDISYPKWRENIIDNMFMVDLFWTSTEEIKTKILELHPNTKVVVVKNTLHPHEPMWSRSNPKWDKDKIGKGRVHIGYVGGTTHYKDLDHLKPAIAKINKYHGKKVIWHHCGYDPNTEHDMKVSANISNVFTGHKNYGNYIAWTGLPINQYGYFYDGLDISIAPLYDNSFNKCKSELKVLESGQKGCAFIGQDMITYSRVDEDIELAYHANEWYEAIMHYVDNRNELEAYKEDMREYAKKYDMDKENLKRLISIVDLLK